MLFTFQNATDRNPRPMLKREAKDGLLKVRAPDRLVSEARAAAEEDGIKVSELVRQALHSHLAERGRPAALRAGSHA